MLKRLWECLTVWSVPPTSLRGAQAILVHAAGENSPDDPEIVNEYNAELVRELYLELKIPVIAQGELRLYLNDIPGTIFSPRQAETAGRFRTANIISCPDNSKACL